MLNVESFVEIALLRKNYKNKTIMDLYNKDKEFTSIFIYWVVCAFISIIGLI